MNDYEDTGGSSPDMEIQEIAVSDIEANSWNANEMDEATFDRLVTELQEVGYIDPIQVVRLDTGKFRILGGEHRWTAAKVLGWEKIKCVVLSGAKWEEEDLQKFVTVRLNMLHGGTNPDKFLKLYDEMASKYGDAALQDLFAYTDQDAWNRLKKDIGKSLKLALPGELAKKFDEATQEVQSVEGLSAILNNLFAQYGSTLEHNFMVFSFGGKTHCYVIMDKTTKKAVDSIMAACIAQKVDINTVIGGAMVAAAASLGE